MLRWDTPLVSGDVGEGSRGLDIAELLNLAECGGVGW